MKMHAQRTCYQLKTSSILIHVLAVPSSGQLISKQKQLTYHYKILLMVK